MLVPAQRFQPATVPPPTIQPSQPVTVVPPRSLAGCRPAASSGSATSRSQPAGTSPAKSSPCGCTPACSRSSSPASWSARSRGAAPRRWSSSEPTDPTGQTTTPNQLGSVNHHPEPNRKASTGTGHSYMVVHGVDAGVIIPRSRPNRFSRRRPGSALMRRGWWGPSRDSSAHDPPSRWVRQGMRGQEDLRLVSCQTTPPTPEVPQGMSTPPDSLQLPPAGASSTATICHWSRVAWRRPSERGRLGS